MTAERDQTSQRLQNFLGINHVLGRAFDKWLKSPSVYPDDTLETLYRKEIEYLGLALRFSTETRKPIELIEETIPLLTKGRADGTFKIEVRPLEFEKLRGIFPDELEEFLLGIFDKNRPESWGFSISIVERSEIDENHRIIVETDNGEVSRRVTLNLRKRDGDQSITDSHSETTFCYEEDDQEVDYLKKRWFNLPQWEFGRLVVAVKLLSIPAQKYRKQEVEPEIKQAFSDICQTVVPSS